MVRRIVVVVTVSVRVVGEPPVGLLAALRAAAHRFTLPADEVYADIVVWCTGESSDLPTSAEACWQYRAARLVVAESDSPSSTAHDALSGGADGVLDADLHGEQLFDALERVAEGELVASLPAPELARPLFARRARECGLTKREAEAIALVGKGLSNSRAAQRMGLSANTVGTYLGSAYRKMGVRSRPEALRWIESATLPP